MLSFVFTTPAADDWYRVELDCGLCRMETSKHPITAEELFLNLSTTKCSPESSATKHTHFAHAGVGLTTLSANAFLSLCANSR